MAFILGGPGVLPGKKIGTKKVPFKQEKIATPLLALGMGKKTSTPLFW